MSLKFRKYFASTDFKISLIFPNSFTSNSYTTNSSKCSPCIFYNLWIIFVVVANFLQCIKPVALLSVPLPRHLLTYNWEGRSSLASSASAGLCDLCRLCCWPYCCGILLALLALALGWLWAIGHCPVAPQNSQLIIAQTHSKSYRILWLTNQNTTKQ